MKPAPAILALAGLALILAGCSSLRRSPAIAAAGVTVTGPTDAGKPATLSTDKGGESLPIPAGSRLVVTKFAAIPFAPATVNAPAQPAQPAREVAEINLSGPTIWSKTAESVRADTGTVDTSIAAKRIDAEENRVLLYAALACMVGACAFFWLHYPSPAMLCACAAGVLFLCWKVANLPPWFWGVAVAAVAVGAGLYLGHERGEKNAPPAPVPK